MPRFLPSLLLAALLLTPIAVFAQTPIPAKLAARNVTIQVAFVSASVTDVDALGINFNLLPLSTPPHTFLMFAKGDIVSQLYQTLTRMRGKLNLAAPVTASDSSPATITADIAVYSALPTTAKSDLLFPQLSGSFGIHGKLTLVPHIRPDNTVDLEVRPQGQGSQKLQLTSVASGQQIVLASSLVQFPTTKVPKNNPFVGSFSGPSKTLPDPQELLIFITPTIAETTPPSPQ